MKIYFLLHYGHTLLRCNKMAFLDIDFSIPSNYFKSNIKLISDCDQRKYCDSKRGDCIQANPFKQNMTFPSNMIIVRKDGLELIKSQQYEKRMIKVFINPPKSPFSNNLCSKKDDK